MCGCFENDGTQGATGFLSDTMVFSTADVWLV